MDEMCASCSLELARKEPAKGPMMQERAAVIRMLLEAESELTPEFAQQRIGCGRNMAATVARAMAAAFRAARERIERGDHVR